MLRCQRGCRWFESSRPLPFGEKNDNARFIDRYKLNLGRRLGDVLGHKELSSRNEPAPIRSSDAVFVPLPGIELLKDYL